MVRALLVSLLAALALVPAADASTVVYAPCPGHPEAMGCLDNATDTIYVTEAGDRDTLLHEQGHVFDRDKLTDRDRRWFTRLLRMRGHAWWETGVEDGENPAERFADAYSLCHQRVRLAVNRVTITAYGYQPTFKRHRRICTAIWAINLIR